MSDYKDAVDALRVAAIMLGAGEQDHHDTVDAKAALERLFEQRDATIAAQAAELEMHRLAFSALNERIAAMTAERDARERDLLSEIRVRQSVEAERDDLLQFKAWAEPQITNCGEHIAERDALREQLRWRDVNSEFPDIPMAFVTIMRDGSYGRTIYDGYQNATHWLPLPPLPNEKP